MMASTPSPILTAATPSSRGKFLKTNAPSSTAAFAGPSNQAAASPFGGTNTNNNNNSSASAGGNANTQQHQHQQSGLHASIRSALPHTHNTESERRHRPPAKKQMGSVFRYLTDVKGSALSEIVTVGGNSASLTAGGGRAQTAPSSNSSPRNTNNTSARRGRSPRGGTALGTSGGGLNFPTGEGKMRMLDDYLRNFPLDRPELAAPLNPKGSGAETEANATTRNNRQAALDQEIKRYEEEAHTRKVGKEAATKTFNNFRKKQNFEGWLAVSERNNRKMRRENDALAKLSQIAQENCIDNDYKYEQVLADLRNSVELAAIIRRRDDPNLKLMETQFDVIDSRIDDICETAKEEVSKEFSNLKKAFERQVNKQNDQLEVVRESGKTTTEEWRKRNREAQTALLSVLQRLVDADEEKQVLQKDLQKLRVAQGAQDGDGELLEESFRKATRRHQQLRDRMQLLEAELSRRNAANFAGKAVEDDVNATTRELIEASGKIGETLLGRDDYQRRREVAAAAIGGGGASPSMATAQSAAQRGGHSVLNNATIPNEASHHASSPSGVGMMLTEAERRQRDYAQTLKNAEELLEAEARNLRAVRASHAAALKERTELEVFLLQAILAHRHWKEHKIKEGALTKPFGSTIDDNNTQTAELVFTADDRKRVIERLLSQERVLHLLYGPEEVEEDSKPTRPSSTSSSAYGLRGVQAITPSLLTAQQQLMPGGMDQTEVSQLWEKWKRWTQEAKSALERQYAAENTKD